MRYKEVEITRKQATKIIVAIPDSDMVGFDISDYEGKICQYLEETDSLVWDNDDDLDEISIVGKINEQEARVMGFLNLTDGDDDNE